MTSLGCIHIGSSYRRAGLHHDEVSFVWLQRAMTGWNNHLDNVVDIRAMADGYNDGMEQSLSVVDICLVRGQNWTVELQSDIPSGFFIRYFKLHFINSVIYSYVSSILHCSLETVL
jgi:hypothetical protein